MSEFRYHPDIISNFPNLAGGVILAQDMRNSPTSEALRQAFIEEQRAILTRIGQMPLSEIASLAAWRGAFRTFGVDPTKYRSAAEALLRRLTKKGDIPNISTIVDICNLVSIRYALPLAAFDAQAVSGAITVRYADGTESFIPHDQAERECPDPGEVIFSDDKDNVVARRWCWKQSLSSAVSIDTTEAIFTIEAQHPNGRADIEAALDDLLGMLKTYAGGNFKTGLLPGAQASIRS
ncbi:MAG: phenylalanine--tRNA ligase beta subunit-related protein [Chloroflexota bacterium]